MSTLPDVVVNIQDGGLGISPPSSTNAVAKIGVCSAGAVNAVLGFGDAGAAAAQLGQGPLVEAVCSTLQAGGGPVYAVPVNPSQVGSVSAVTAAVTGSGALAVSTGPTAAVAVDITTGGASGTAAYRVAVGGGTYGPTATTATTAAALPGAGLGLVTFPTGTYVANDVWTFSPTGGAATVTGTGTVAPTAQWSPADNYNVQVVIKGAGNLGAATFTYSLDGGNSVSSQILVPTAGVFAIPNSGVVLTFSGTNFKVGDTFTFTTTTAGFTNTDLPAAMAALSANPASWGHVHIVGAPATAAAAAATAAVVDTQLQAMQAQYRFTRALTECPNVESDNTIEAAFQNFASVLGRIGVGCGDVNMASPLTGRIVRRNPAWAASNRMSVAPPGEDLAWVGRGPLSQVVSLTRDENATPGLDAARFITCRTIIGAQGYYLTNGRLMSAAGSDFQYVQHGRVMDRACSIARQAMLQYLNGSVRVDATTGYIDARDAKKIEAAVNARLNAGLVATGDASASTVAVSRTQNILSTNMLPVTVKIVPLGYNKSIPLTIGFMNPAIQTA